MLYVRDTDINKILCLLLLVVSFSAFSQTLTISKPKIIGYGGDTGFKSVCVRKGDDPNYTLSFTKFGFSSGTVFNVELSNSEGVFDDDPLSLGSIASPKFVVRIKITVPRGTYGERYRIRIRTKGAKEVVSEPSDEFAAYYIDETKTLILNGGKDVALCNGGDKEISLNDETKRYVWYREGIEIKGETKPTLRVSREGQYYAKPYYGECRSRFSTSINVRAFSTTSVRILGGSSVAICGNEVYTLRASITDTSTYNYTWYKNGDIIENAKAPTYVTPDSDQLGEYEVALTPKLDDACVSKSPKVVLYAKTGNNFSVDVVGDKELIVFPSKQADLEITHSLAKAKIQWFLNGKRFPGFTTSKIRVSNPGAYYAKVTDESSSCALTKNSDTIVVLGIKKLLPQIKADEDYASCEATKAKVELAEVKVLATNDKEYSLSETQTNSLTYNWYKDDKLISDSANKRSLNISSYKESGDYKIQATVKDLSGQSEVLKIALLAAEFKFVSNSKANVLCANETIKLNVEPIVEGYTYKWYKDDEPLKEETPAYELSEIGKYSVIVAGFKCEKLFEVEIKKFNDATVTTKPSKIAILPDGESVEIVADGAESYEWYNSDGDLLSTTNTFKAEKIGTYTIVAKVNKCSVTKKISVEEDDGKVIIPNILTPFNADGNNDTWKLPNRYSYQSAVQVIIYDSQGKEVLNTTDYQNDWPQIDKVKDGTIFYFKVLRENELVKAGTISVLK